VTADEALNVRAGPGPEYSVVTWVIAGEVVELTGYRNEDTTWVSIETADGIEGWVYTFYIESDFPLEQLQVWTEEGTATPSPTPTSEA
jgi:uncharacterized protein YraI